MNVWLKSTSTYIAVQLVTDYDRFDICGFKYSLLGTYGKGYIECEQRLVSNFTRIQNSRPGSSFKPLCNCEIQLAAVLQ